MGRRFITAQDIDDLIAEGHRELRVDATTRLTDLARERARDRGVTLVETAGAGGAQTVAVTTAAAPVPGHAPVAAPAPASGPLTSGGRGAESTPAPGPADLAEHPRRKLRAAIRAGVVAEFGTAPPGLDAAIGRVLDRFGIED
ncbi:MAG: hypothetical protein ACLFS9_08240 [Nitriliruptoraceae bacterium]